MSNIVSEKMYALGSKRSEIRELFEYGKKRIAEVGAEGPKDMGKVMGVATKRLAGLAEGRMISALVKNLLSK